MTTIGSIIQAFETKVEQVLKADRPALNALAVSVGVVPDVIDRLPDVELRNFCIRRIGLDLAYDARKDALRCNA
jgi:hypothetical protein